MCYNNNRTREGKLLKTRKVKIMNPTLMNDILNGCPCNEPQRFQCILHDMEDSVYDRYLFLTDDQIHMIKYLLTEDVLDSDVYKLTVLKEERKTFEKV